MLTKQISISRILVLLIALLGTWQLPASAQTGVVIKGKVTETPSGDALPGVSVVEINSNGRQVNGASTDASGNYTLRVSDVNNKLRISYIGSKTQTVSIGTRTVINVALQAASGELAEVAITGKKAEVSNTGFTTVSRREMTGAISSIKAEVLEKEPVTSIDQMLQGRAAGVQVVPNSGDPGDGAEIRIRGTGSISGNNQPLYVVDGVPIISTTYDTSDGNRANTQSNPIADLNPSDIERIDILKDGAAAVLYGSRAANGVIMITTKRSKPGVTQVTLKFDGGVNLAPGRIPVLDGSSYKIMRLEAEQNAGNINPISANNRPLVDDPTYSGYYYYQANTNWLDLLMINGLTQNYNLSVMGGGESMKYTFSSRYANNHGYMIGSGATSIAGRFNLDYTISSKLTIRANIALTRSMRKSNNGDGGIYSVALTRPSALPNMDVDANGNPIDQYFSLGGVTNSQDNPVAYAKLVTNRSNGTNLNPNISAELRLGKGLMFTSNASMGFVSDNNSRFTPPEATGTIWNDKLFNQLTTSDSERAQVNFDAYFKYARSFGKLSVDGLIGSNVYIFQNNSFQTTTYATATGNLMTPSSASGVGKIAGSPGNDGSISGFFQAGAAWDDKYRLQVSMRRDGSSKFGNSRKYAFFPAVSGYWRLSSQFFRDVTWMRDLKIRGSWGQLGNQPGAQFAYLSQFTAGKQYIDLNGVAQNSPQLNNLRWETSESSNIGLDADLFDSRVTVNFDFYTKVTKDLLYGLPLPSSSGLNGTILMNLGKLRNRGYDLDIAVDVIKGKKPGDFGWTTTFNVGNNFNRILSLPGGTLKFANAGAGFTGQVAQGDAIGSYYGYVFKGVYSRDADAAVHDVNGNIVYELDGITPKIMRVGSETGNIYKGGDAIYEDFNHDGVINNQDRVRVGNGNALFSGSIGTTFTYKRASLTLYLPYQYGNDIINGLRYNLERMNGVENQATTVLKRWRKQGDVTDMPRALRGDSRNSEGSTRWIENGSYMRLQTVTIGYQAPSAWVRKFGFRALSGNLIFGNLMTFTKYSGADPQISISGNPSFIGMDGGMTPRQRTIQGSLNLSF